MLHVTGTASSQKRKIYAGLVTAGTLAAAELADHRQVQAGI